MTFNPDRHHRRSIRLRGYDYSRAGAYFVTICARQRECLFGDVIDDAMVLNDAGRVVADEWTRSAALRAEVDVDEWVVLPNHVHGIVVIADRRDDARAYVHTPVRTQDVSGVRAYGGTPIHDDHDEHRAYVHTPVRTHDVSDVGAYGGTPIHDDHDDHRAYVHTPLRARMGSATRRRTKKKT